jgi:pentatricopeptide repeat protein
MYAALLNAHLRSKEMRQAKRLFTHIHQLVPSTPLVSIQQATRVHKALLRYAYTIANARLYLTLIKQMEQRLAALGDGRLPWSLWLRCFRLHVMHGRRSKAAEVWKMAMAKPALGKPRDAHKNATVIMQRQASGAAHHVSDIRHLEQILLDMETLQLPIPPRIVANAMHTYRSRGMFQQAVDLFQRHKDLLRTSEYAAEYVYLWTEAMAVYADLFDPKQVDRLFHEMQERGIHPSPVTWAARIHAWARCGEFDAVYGLLVQLHATTPAVRSVLLNAYIQFDRMEEAIVRWLPEFTLKERPRMHPILVNTLLAGWSRKGTIGRALQLWHSLASSEWDQITIRIMLNMCLWHRLEEGEAVWQRLVESGRDIWYSCWYTRAKYLGHAEQWEVLQRTLYTMPTKFVSKDLVAMCIALMRHAQQEHAASQVLAWARGRSIGVSERSIHDCQTALARHMTS